MNSLCSVREMGSGQPESQEPVFTAARAQLQFYRAVPCVRWPRTWTCFLSPTAFYDGWNHARSAVSSISTGVWSAGV